MKEEKLLDQVTCIFTGNLLRNVPFPAAFKGFIMEPCFTPDKSVI